ncbi:homeodomain-like protein [Tanacetum coccineum]
MEESLKKFMAESEKRHHEHSSLIKEIQASTDAAIRNQGALIKALEIQIQQMSKEKSRIEEEIKATMNVHHSSILKDALPPKEKDLRSFTLPCNINNMCFDKALADLGANVSVMPYSTFTNLGLGKLAPTKLITELADKTVKRLQELNDHEMEDLDPEIEECEIIDEPKVDVVEIRHDDEIVEKIDEYPSFCDYDRKIHIYCAYNLQFSCMIGYEHVNANFFSVLSINVMSKSFYNSTMKEKIEYKGKNVVGVFMNVPIFVGNFSIIIDFAIVENMDAYRDKDMGDVIVRKPFCRVACVEAKWFDRFITIHDGNDNVTYQMARSHPRFKHLFNEQCNKILQLLQVSARDILEGNFHRYQKLKGFFKGILNLGPEYIRNEKMVEWPIRGHISMHKMD